jgi:hypothetical protein
MNALPHSLRKALAEYEDGLVKLGFTKDEAWLASNGGPSFVGRLAAKRGTVRIIVADERVSVIAFEGAVGRGAVEWEARLHRSAVHGEQRLHGGQRHRHRAGRR